MIPRDLLQSWASRQPGIVALFVFGSRARGTAHPQSDIDLAFELDDSRETQDTVLITNHQRWRAELQELTSLQVKDMHLRRDPQVTGAVVEVYRRAL